MSSPRIHRIIEVLSGGVDPAKTLMPLLVIGVPGDTVTGPKVADVHGAVQVSVHVFSYADSVLTEETCGVIVTFWPLVKLFAVSGQPVEVLPAAQIVAVVPLRVIAPAEMFSVPLLALAFAVVVAARIAGVVLRRLRAGIRRVAGVVVAIAVVGGRRRIARLTLTRFGTIFVVAAFAVFGFGFGHGPTSWAPSWLGRAVLAWGVERGGVLQNGALAAP